MIFKPLFKNASSLALLEISSKLNVCFPKTLSSGKKVTEVPVVLLVPISFNGATGTPLCIFPFSSSYEWNSTKYFFPPLFTVTLHQRERALVTDAPTP